MAGRIALLVFATGMFISVWNAANKKPHSAIAVRHSQSHTPPLPPIVLSSGTIALPPDIGPGTYRVVDDQGAVDIIRVTRGQLDGNAAGIAPGRRIYECKVGTRSVFFIRIRLHEESARSPRTNPKYDFTGYLDLTGESVR
jgi:hypothetical protein